MTINKVQSSHVFQDITEQRVTQAICSITLGEEYCSPPKDRYADAFLALFRHFIPKAETKFDEYGRNVIEFKWADADYQVLCGGGTCYITRLAPQPEKDLGEIAIEAFANIITLGFASCVEMPEPFVAEDIGQFVDTVDTVDVAEIKDYSKEKGWVFCAKSSVVEEAEDCHLNTNIQDKMSDCVSLYDIYDGYHNFSNEILHKDDIYYDHDKLMTFLLGGTSGDRFHFCFKGDKEWPEGLLECSSQEQKYGKGLWCDPGYICENSLVKIIPNKDAWSAQVWFRQPPDLCWAVYKTPCNDADSVCGN